MCSQASVMAKKAKKLGPKLEAWVTARKKHKLSHAQVQMARELGLNPKKLGGKDNHDQQPWKMPLSQFIEHLYFERFSREKPELVLSIEEKFRLDEKKKAAKKTAKAALRSDAVRATETNES